jgi:hypothetical protein
VLKGGMLLAAFDARRPTADADALGRDITNDEATIVARVVEIARQPVAEDGVEFRTETVSARTIRDESLYSGLRIAMDAWIATATVKFRLDVNFGDLVTPAPQQIALPALRPGASPVGLSSAIDDLVLLRGATYHAYRAALRSDGTDRPFEFGDIVAAVTAFADPLAEPALPTASWRPATRSWNR